MIAMLHKLLSLILSLTAIPLRLKKFAHPLLRGLDKLVSGACLLCGGETETALCKSCKRQYFFRPANRCITCAVPLNRVDARCGSCLSDAPAFDRTIVAFDYLSPLDQLILALKFDHQLIVAPTLAQALAQTAMTSLTHSQDIPDFFIPVPLGRTRLSERGFNQSYEIAKPFAKLVGRPVYSQLLLRVRDTQAQTLLHPDQRQDNVRHAFFPNERYADKIGGCHIGVVDDVMTTGATLHEIAACLKRHGARKVSNYVVARTPPH
jgi:ComF family protein